MKVVRKKRERHLRGKRVVVPADVALTSLKQSHARWIASSRDWKEPCAQRTVRESSRAWTSSGRSLRFTENDATAAYSAKPLCNCLLDLERTRCRSSRKIGAVRARNGLRLSRAGRKRRSSNAPTTKPSRS